ncbi:TniB family NTP-binding protein [Alicyclobacillus fastidiosus]|uniref:TniB family NTP-binding protein n=1 Tax=Alicyclobacillus fastidiosus TaxID=392011 RepID=A0ABY6ZCT9_9BACL|nr:TniB family NTP-binding protein [Alicyclobacillus fastidiosus]WAH40714.1 TniB family NTP-binding protein [Alicyclobacillus fastidiosus]GMA62186.1 hypothetical protein GCM10025859_26260 [Alicyclobacillus fastidiosus]
MAFESSEFLNRLATLEGIHPQQKRLFDRIDALRWNNSINQNWTQNMVLVGESGVGKTHLIRKYVSDSKLDHAGTKEGSVPILYLHSPLPFSLQALYLSINESLHNTVPKTSRLSFLDLQRETISLLAARDVAMIILDDAHNIGMSRNGPMFKVMDSMKHLSETANVALVLVGLEEIRGMVEGNCQYARRFPVLELHRFELDEDFVEFLHSLEEQISPLPVNLSNKKLAGVLYSLSEGLIGTLMPLIQLALRKMSLENSFERLTLDHFVHTLLDAKEALCIRQ